VRRFALLVALVFALGVSQADAQFICPTAKLDPGEVIQERVQPKPNVGASFVDSAYQTCFMRITDDALLPTIGNTQNSVPIAPSIQAWNSDQTKLFLASGYILNSPSWSVARYFPSIAATDFRWSPVDPTAGYFSLGCQLLRMDVTTASGLTTVVHSFNEYGAGLENHGGHGDLSRDGRFTILKGYRHWQQTDTLDCAVTMTAGDSTLVSDAQFDSVDVGSTVFAPGIPNGAVVQSKTDASHLTLSVDALQTNACTVHFGNSECFLYDLVTDRKGSVLRTAAPLTDAFAISPSGRYVVVHSQGDSLGTAETAAYDTSMARLGVISTGSASWDLATDDTGVEWCVQLVPADSLGPERVAKYRLPRALDDLRNGDGSAVTDLIPWYGSAEDCGISARALDMGYVLLSSIEVTGVRHPCSNEVVKVYLDSSLSSPHVERLADTRSRESQAGACGIANGAYWARPHATVSRDGTRVLWGSTWDGCVAESYAMDICNKARNSMLIALPVNTWVKLNPTVKNSLGANEPFGFPKMQFSKAVFAPEYGAILSWGGGGHGQSRIGNDMWLYYTAKNEWRQQTPGDPLSAYPNPGLSSPSLGQYCNNDSSHNANPPWSYCNPTLPQYLPIGSTTSGAPWTSENYNQHAWDSYNRRFVMYGPNYLTGAMSDTNAWFAARASYYYDPLSRHWTFIANNPHLYHQGGTMEFDPVQKKMVAANHTWWTRPGYSDQSHQRWWLDVTTNTWTQCPGNGNGDPQPDIFDQQLVYDRQGGTMLVYGADYPNTHDLYSYTLRTDSWKLLHPASDPVYGVPPAAAPSAAISSKDNVMLIFGWGGDSNPPNNPVPLWAYDIGENAWRRVQPPAGGWQQDPYVPGETILITWTSLLYDPTNNVFFLIRSSATPENTIGGWPNSIIGELWAYKLSSGDGTNRVATAIDSQDRVPPYTLDQNFPNPFNPSTTIRFALRSPEHVVLRVFDLRGRLVTTLLDRNEPAGIHSVEWRGLTGQGQAAASGVYFYRLDTSSGTRASKRMVLLK